MNAENFAQYLKNPSQLYQISYQELKSLVLQYPYCQNLHYLLLLKSKIDQHKDLPSNLEKAAAYSIDRTFLYKLIKEKELEAVEAESFMINEDYLELKDLSVLEESPSIVKDQEESQTMTARMPEAETSVLKPELETLLQPNEEEEEDFDETVSEVLETQALEKPENPPNADKPAADLSAEIPGSIVHDRFAADLAAFACVIENFYRGGESDQENEVTETHKPMMKSKNDNIPFEITNDNKRSKAEGPLKPAPSPKSSFTSWIEQFQTDPLGSQMSEIMESRKREEIKWAKKQLKKKKRKKKKKQRKTKVSEIAKNSIRDNNEIASETLARILVAQEQYAKAIKVYERLILKFPEKSTYFAGQIENLKNR